MPVRAPDVVLRRCANGEGRPRPAHGSAAVTINGDRVMVREASSSACRRTCRTERGSTLARPSCWNVFTPISRTGKVAAHRVEVVCHRGASAVAPENTWAAARQVRRMGRGLH